MFIDPHSHAVIASNMRIRNIERSYQENERSYQENEQIYQENERIYKKNEQIHKNNIYSLSKQLKAQQSDIELMDMFRAGDQVNPLLELCKTMIRGAHEKWLNKYNVTADLLKYDLRWQRANNRYMVAFALEMNEILIGPSYAIRWSNKLLKMEQNNKVVPDILRSLVIELNERTFKKAIKPTVDLTDAVNFQLERVKKKMQFDNDSPTILLSTVPIHSFGYYIFLETGISVWKVFDQPGRTLFDMTIGKFLVEEDYMILSDAVIAHNICIKNIERCYPQA